MRIRVTLWGGASYAHDDESWPVRSLARAAAMWDDRRSSHGHRKCETIDADGDVEHVYFPCWGDVDAEEGGTYVGMAWYVNDDDDDDPIGSYPDKVLVLGPRGGLRWRDA